MSYEKAISIINLVFKNSKVIEDVCDYDFWCCLKTAVERQIQKKPIVTATATTELYSCPHCGSLLLKGNHHCLCGQFIDWSE